MKLLTLTSSSPDFHIATLDSCYLHFPVIFLLILSLSILLSLCYKYVSCPKHIQNSPFKFTIVSFSLHFPLRFLFKLHYHLVGVIPWIVSSDYVSIFFTCSFFKTVFQLDLGFLDYIPFSQKSVNIFPLSYSFSNVAEETSNLFSWPCMQHILSNYKFVWSKLWSHSQSHPIPVTVWGGSTLTTIW